MCALCVLLGWHNLCVRVFSLGCVRRVCVRCVCVCVFCLALSVFVYVCEWFVCGVWALRVVLYVCYALGVICAHVCCVRVCVLCDWFMCVGMCVSVRCVSLYCVSVTWL